MYMVIHEKTEILRKVIDTAGNIKRKGLHEHCEYTPLCA